MTAAHSYVENKPKKLTLFQKYILTVWDELYYKQYRYKNIKNGLVVDGKNKLYMVITLYNKVFYLCPVQLGDISAEVVGLNRNGALELIPELVPALTINWTNGNLIDKINYLNTNQSAAISKWKILGYFDPSNREVMVRSDLYANDTIIINSN